jgi:mono/diheme cytochrome c family protein
MKKLLVILAGFILGAGLFGVISASAADYERGQSLFADKCVICHGSDGKGNGPAAASLSPSPPDFTSNSFWEKTNDASITDTIENGHGPMPAFRLSSGDVKAIIDYMKHSLKP